MQPIGIRPTNDFAFKKTFGSPENKVALISLLNAILALPIPIVDVTIENPYSLGGIIFGRASLRPLACWTVGCIATCSTGVQRFKTLGFENAHLLTM